MESEQWRRVEALFLQALSLHDGERESYLQTAANGDPELLREVNDLLRSYKLPGSFMEQPVFMQGLHVLSGEDSDEPKDLGRYRIIKRIGAGGMGEVFLAHDSVLDRQVAIKLLPKLLTDDPQRIRRFQQEAHAASTISHPNVAHIYEIGVEGNCHFTSMEYVEGQTLREVLNHGRLTIVEALEISLQVARALESAHASGVIHRDIKPENIMIRPDGYVKVLDFGLAKLHRITDEDDPSQTQAATMIKTEPGLLMGSPAYMSPEQARGVDVDARTDIWSLGVVLYEMLCGWTPFQGSTRMDLLVALLREEPAPISASLRHAHPGLRRLLNRMLSKDKDQRYLTIAEVIVDVENLLKDLRWSAKQGQKSKLFQGSQFALLKHKALQAYRAADGTSIKTPLPFFLMAIVLGIALTWALRNTEQLVLDSDAELEAGYQAGVEAIFRDDMYTAAHALSRAATFSLHKSTLLTHARLAEVWAELDYYDRANHELSYVASIIPIFRSANHFSETDALYVEAIRATIQRNFQSAANLHKQIVEKDPSNSVAWMDLGRSYERIRWWDEAANSYRRACAINPSLASAFLRLGTVEAAKGDTQAANTAFEQAQHLYKTAKDNAGTLQVLNLRSVLAHRLGKNDEANNFIREADSIPYGDFYSEVKTNFALAAIFHKESEQAKWFESEARRHAESIRRAGLLFRGPDQLLVNGLVEIAMLYLRDNDLINAQKYTLEALKIAQRSDLKISKAKALYVYGQLYLHEGFPANADQQFKEALRFEFPNADFSDKQIALWRNTIFDVDYETAIARFGRPLEAMGVVVTR